MIDTFLAAVGEGQLEDLIQLLADDVVLWADGGGKARGAALVPLRGREQVARFILASPRFVTEPLQPVIGNVNGEPALLLTAQGKTRLVVMLGVDGKRVREIRVMGNPDKLGGVAEPRTVG